MLSEQEVLHIGKLANFTLSEAEVKKFQLQLTSIIEYLDQLKKINTDGIEVTSHPIKLQNRFQDKTDIDYNGGLDIEKYFEKLINKKGRLIKTNKVKWSE